MATVREMFDEMSLNVTAFLQVTLSLSPLLRASSLTVLFVHPLNTSIQFGRAMR